MSPFLSKILLACSLCSFLAACSMLPSNNAEEISTYTLSLSKLTQPVSNAKGKTLLVSLPNAVAGLDTIQQLYAYNNNDLRAYNKTQWIDTPSKMLLPLLVQRLESTGQFSAVLSANSTAIGELRLESDLLKFHQDFSVKPSQWRIALRVQLLDVLQRQVLKTHIFEVSAPAPTDNSEGGVTAANQAVEQLLTQIAETIQ